MAGAKTAAVTEAEAGSVSAAVTEAATALVTVSWAITIAPSPENPKPIVLGSM